MSGRALSDPTPWQTGLMHGVMSLAVFSGILGTAGLGVHLTGDAKDAGPRLHYALFESREGPARTLKLEQPIDDYPVLAAQPSPALALASYDTPASLPVDEPDTTVNPIDDMPAPRRPVAPDSIIINGTIVPAGKSLSEVTAEISLPRAPVSGLFERVGSRVLPVISEDGRRPEKVYARPVRNPEGRPTVSIIVGGLGINYGTTNAAIRDLPPEVTLSFVAGAPNLSTLVRRARNAGHEVLIELPMEGFDKEGGKPPANLLRAGDVENNTARLTRLLGSTSGYFGVTNYKGNKFGIDLASVGPVIKTLAERGVAFVEDGSLSDGQFEFSSRTHGASFARSDLVIDSETNANAIEAKLFSLETEARRSGAAMGTGFAFPLTVDTVKTWAASLDEKGLVLVPASSRLSRVSLPETAALPSGSGGSQ